MDVYVFVYVVVDEEDKKPKRVVDVGCGIGGSTRYLARKYGASCVGFTINPVQVQRAQALTASQGLDDKVCEFITSSVLFNLMYRLVVHHLVVSFFCCESCNNGDNIWRRRNKTTIHIFYVIQQCVYIHGNDGSKFYYN